MKTAVRFSLISCFICLSALTGCSGTASTGGDTGSEIKDTAQSAWNAVSFAMNATNPVYYAKKAAKYGYDTIRDDEQEE